MNKLSNIDNDKKKEDQKQKLENDIKKFLTAVSEEGIEKENICAPIPANLVENLRAYAANEFTTLANICREILIVFAAKKNLLPTQNLKTGGKIPSEKSEINAERMVRTYIDKI